MAGNKNVHKITLEAPKIKIDTKRQDDAIDDHFKEISYFLGQIQTFELGYKLDFSKDREIKQNSRSVLDEITAKIWINVGALVRSQTSKGFSPW